MKITLVNSRQDQAGVTIRDQIRILMADPAYRREGVDWEFLEVDGRLIHEGGIDADLGSDLLIFLSRHTSSRPVPVLTVHPTGNPGEALLGGEAGSFAPAAPGWMQAVLVNLVRLVPNGYRASYEVTHHGPTDLVTPSFFVEIGSTEKEWSDRVAGAAVAEAVLTAAPADPISLIGFGGTHYAPRETAVALETRGAFGHILHSREIGGLTGPLLGKIAAAAGAEAVYVDRKAIDRPALDHLYALLQAASLPLLGEKDLHQIGVLSWQDYLSLRQVAEEAAPGAHLIPGALSGGGTPVTVTVPADLFTQALSADPGRIVAAIGRMPVAGLTGKGGVLLPIFITYERYSSQIIHDLITLCVKTIREEQHAVIDGDRLIIKKERFDPGLAASLGVPPGALFGMLKGGQAVRVGDQVIEPEMVRSCTVTAIHLRGLERYT
ncbi:D-aminoacyl-tRNA deacylase [Methanosphaerula subterraneus]|uniref:D-aminoacyl-tRNA deacylase n=1 Tax=Methanosphaerula subterraneus TaxID=3350244 RepID=UPI003F8273A5